MSLKRERISVIYRTLLYTTLALSAVALIAELLPEVKAKMIVIPVLLLIMSTCIFDIIRLKRDVE